MKKKMKKGGVPSTQRHKKGYAKGGVVKMGTKPTNQKTVKAKGAGAATRGYNFKV